MKKSFIAVFCVLAVMSCSWNKEKIIYSDGIKVPEECKIAASVINDRYMFNYPQDILVMDSLLIVQDSDGMKTAFHVFDKTTGRHLTDFGFRGRGPGETFNISSANLYDGTLYVYDATLRKLVLYDIHEALAGNRCWTEVPIDDVAPNMVLQVVPAGDGRLILCGNDGRMRFGLWRMSSDEMEAMVNEYPPYSEDEEADFAISCYSASVKFSETENKLVSGTYIGAVMEIYDVTPNGIRKTFSGYYHRPRFEYAHGAVPRWVVPGKDTVIGFQDISLTASGIYGLIWGVRTLSPDGPVPELIRFGYDGTPECRYMVPDIMTAFAVDRNGDIYGMALNDDMEFNIRKYVRVPNSDNDRLKAM